jgi:hypothetical protein
MKKIIAILLTAMLLVTPVLANWEPEENAGNITATINSYVNKPEINGEIGEYSYTQINYSAGDISYAWDQPESEAIAKGLDFQIYATYDANNIYVLIETDADNYYIDAPDGDGNAWQYSVIQMNFAAASDFGTDRLEFGIWKNSTDGELGGVVWAQHPMANEFEPAAGTNYTVVANRGRLFYEVVVPFNTFLEKDTVSEGDVIGMCFVMGQSTGDGSGHIHTQYASGCTGGTGKDAELFAKITLGGQMAGPPAEVEPEVEDAPVADLGTGGGAPETVAVAPVAPPTSDSIVIFAVLAAFVLAAAAVVRKKISVK